MPLEDAIKDAIEKNQETPPPDTEEVETTEEDAQPTSEEAEEETLDESELKEAANLYKLLKDKDTRRLVLKTLGEKAGLFDKPIENQKQEEKAKRGIRDILTEKLGKEYEFLIPKLGDALESIMDSVREEQQMAVGQVQQEQINQQVVSELSELARETKGVSRGLESRMSALAQKFPPGEGLAVKEYVRGLYAMANSGKPSSANKIAERINRNSKDVPSRLQSSTGSLKDSPKAMPKMKIDEAIKYALKQMGMDKD